MEERENVIRILKEAKVALKREDSVKLKELSNQTIHTASIAKDPDNIVVAVIIYALSKIIERKDYKTKPGWEKLYANILIEIDHSIDALSKQDKTHLRSHLEGLRKKIEGVSGKMKKYIQDVFIKARINKASRIYEHGISMETTAGLLGLTMFDLAGYTGQTGIADVPANRTLDAKTRIKIAMELFS